MDKINQALKISIIAGIIILVACAIYFIVDKKIQSQKQESYRQAQEQENAKLLDNCIAIAYTTFHTFWNSECKTQKMEEDCGLPSLQANNASNYHRELKDDCFKRYGK